MAWRNLWRNPKRTLITLSSVMFAVLLSVTMKSFQDGIFSNLVKNVVSLYSGYIQIHKNGYWEEQILENTFRDDGGLFKKLNENSSIHSWVPRLESFMLVSFKERTYGCMVVGTDFNRENELSKLKNKIVKGNYHTESNESVLIGEGLAINLAAGLNDTIVLLGQGYQGSVAAAKLRINGILKFGSPQLNKSVVYVPLQTARHLLDADSLNTAIALNIKDERKLSNVSQWLKKNLNDEYEVMTWKEMMPEIEKHIEADSVNFYIMTGVLYLIISFGIFGTVLMMLNERRLEFGMLIAIGMRKLRLANILFLETIFISLSGTLIGGILSIPVVYYFSKYPIRIGGDLAKAYEQFGFEALFPTLLDPGIFINQTIIVLILTLIIGLYPLWFVKKIDPVKAIRR